MDLTSSCCLDKQVYVPRMNMSISQYNKARIGLQILPHHDQASNKHSLQSMSWRKFSLPVSTEEEFPLSQPENYLSDDEYASEDLSENPLAQPLKSDVLKSLLADSERAKLIKKLSEANQQNRFLRRQLLGKEDTLVDLKNKLATVQLEIQALVKLAEEIARTAIFGGSRKINGKYIQSHLLSRLEVVNGKLKDQIRDAKAAQSREVNLSWCGMAESVQVMGSFDGWNQGEHLSPEYTGSYTKFSTTVLLRPGRYEIKFLVDGEWQLSPEFPTVGEGAMENNLLVVK